MTGGWGGGGGGGDGGGERGGAGGGGWHYILNRTECQAILSLESRQSIVKRSV